VAHEKAMTSPSPFPSVESPMAPGMVEQLTPPPFTELSSRVLDTPMPRATTRSKRKSTSSTVTPPPETIPQGDASRATNDVPSAKRVLFYVTAPAPSAPAVTTTPYLGQALPPRGPFPESPPAFEFTPHVRQTLNFRQSYLPMYLKQLFGQLFHHAEMYDGLLEFVQKTVWALYPKKIQPSVGACFMYLASVYNHSNFLAFFASYCVKRPQDIPVYESFAVYLRRVFRYTRAQLVVTKNPLLIDAMLTGAVHDLDIDSAVGALKVNPRFTRCGGDTCKTSMCVNPLCILVERCKRECGLDMFECKHEEMRLLLNLFFE